jgi:hypothetical protein
MVFRFFDKSLDQIRNLKLQYIERIAAGSAQSYDDYRFICGKIQGLDKAEEILIDIIKNIESSPKPNNNKDFT